MKNAGKNYSDLENIFDPLKVCMVCGSTIFKFLYKVADTNQNVPGAWDILSCSGCGTGVLSPFPNNTEISGFYRNVFYTEEGKRFRNWMEWGRKLLARLRSILLNRMKPSRGRLLDFGSGTGHFSEMQIKAGWYVSAVDPYSAVSSDANFCQVTENGIELQYGNETFDAISLWYVIEHLRNPAQALQEMTRVLKKDGVLLLATQDFSSYQACYFGINWLYLDPPRHVWQFTSESLTQLCCKYGDFRVVKISHSSIEYGPFSILQSALNMIVGNHNDLFRFLKNSNLRKTEPSLSARELYRLSLSFVLLPLMAPLVLFIYCFLLIFRQGDVFTLYLVKN
jgi:SAM-dependent methyltransferase